MVRGSFSKWASRGVAVFQKNNSHIIWLGFEVMVDRLEDASAYERVDRKGYEIVRSA
jgi:hypothetical protein